MAARAAASFLLRWSRERAAVIPRGWGAPGIHCFPSQAPVSQVPPCREERLVPGVLGRLLQPRVKPGFRPATGSPGVGPKGAILSPASFILICILHRCSRLIVGLQRCRLMRCAIRELEAPGSAIVMLALAGGMANIKFIFRAQLSRRTQEQNSSCDHREHSL